MDPQKLLQDSLTQRLRMQIALSSVPVVEEWMDTKLSRWLESVPTPMEMGSGGEAHLSVVVGSDLQSLEWRAHGTPSGFIPKLAKYLDESGASPADLARINAIGEAFEPDAVGSFCAALPGALSTGWQFEHAFELDALAGHLGECAGQAAAIDALEELGASTCTNVSAALGDPGAGLRAPISDAAAAVRRYGSVLPGRDPAPLVAFLETSRIADPQVVVGYGESAVHSVGLQFGGIKSDDVAALCKALGCGYEPTSLTIGNAVGSEGIVDLRVMFREGREAATVELGFVPGSPPEDDGGQPRPKN